MENNLQNVSNETPPKPTLPVGVSVLLLKGDMLLLGVRKGSHAAGYYSTPGGRIEHNESMIQCAIRETREETGITLLPQDIKFLMVKEHFRFGKHYIMFYVYVQDVRQEPRTLEPDKREGWDWVSLDVLDALPCTEPADVQSTLKLVLKGVEPKVAFESTHNLSHTFPSCHVCGKTMIRKCPSCGATTGIEPVEKSIGG